MALEHLHQSKVMHKDLKCGNVLLTNRSVVKLSDFGCSKHFDRTTSFIQYQQEGSKTQKGTPHWMAPESVTEAQYNVQSDIWSLGCTLLELATGLPPWHELGLDSHKTMMYIGQKEEIPNIPENLPGPIKKLVRACLVREPKDRCSLK